MFEQKIKRTIHHTCGISNLIPNQSNVIHIYRFVTLKCKISAYQGGHNIYLYPINAASIHIFTIPNKTQINVQGQRDLFPQSAVKFTQ